MDHFSKGEIWTVDISVTKEGKLNDLRRKSNHLPRSRLFSSPVSTTDTVMEVFFERNNVILFSMELDPSTTVLEMKQEIKKSTGIAVSDQTIFFKGKLLFADRDSLTLTQCKIVKKSRVELYFPLSRYNISLILQQMQQSPAPSTSVNIEDSPEKNQDSNVMDKSNDGHQVLHQLEKSLVPSWSIDEVFGTQEWPAATEGNVSVPEPSWRNNNVHQAWLQRESSSSTSNIFGDFLFDEDNNQMLQPTEQSLAQSTSVQASLGDYQDWSAVERSIFFQMLDQPEQSLAGSAMARQDKNQDLFQSGPSSTSNTFGGDLPLPTELFSNIQSHWPASTTQEHRISDQYLPVSQVVQTQTPTRSIRHVINIPDSPENSSKKRAKNLSTVMVLSFPVSDTPAIKFPVEVNASDNVEVLRTELAKMQQRCQLLLPEGGHFFIHKTQILYEKQSFRWNRVAQGDTIEIFPGSVTR